MSYDIEKDIPDGGYRLRPLDTILIVVIIALVAVIAGGLLCGCGDVEQIITEASEILDQIPTPHPGETATPTPAPQEATVHQPESYITQQNSTLPLGVCMATQNYVPGGKDKGCSISIVHFRIQHRWDLKNVTKDFTQLVLSGPNGSNSWNTGSGYAYTTRYATNPDTGYQQPLADGTSRGLAMMEFSSGGVYDLYCKAKLTENRGTSFLGVTVEESKESNTTYWWRWDQRSPKSTSAEIQFGSKVRFKRKAK